jgi:hypothetical protein
MFGLIRFLFSLVLFGIVIWFATTVPLGKHTLWGHLQAIFSTQEAKDLAEGTKEEAKKVADRVRDELKRDGGVAATERQGKPPLDPLDARDQKSLDQLVRDKTRGKK